ncbi:hypothetical protein CF392_02625 [Tamilnaduibacter salinus]|uniref:Beta-barrel porin 2 n=1 Tax=Tamilnaduibacter salinus TaxID=1484056 RepID=A0A2A2I4W5_9GAMM|nr:outer membrane beta-barrel protein [Tamilnaduibacter salinus]PAV27051.1 hypothetical protein CF392_02625 [Tamilnaduibacter salinus]
MSASLGAAILGSGAAMADPVQVGVGLTSRYSDNMTASRDNPQSDLETRANITIEHQAQPGRCETTLGADIGYGVFLEDTFDSTLYTQADATGQCQLTDRLSWHLTDSLRDVRRRSTRPARPDNTSRRNTVRTGPDYQFRLGPRDTWRLSSRYQNTTFDDREQDDSDRISASTAWTHLFSARLSGGLQASGERVEYDSGEEVDSATGTVFFSREYQATSISGSYGVTRQETRFRNIDISTTGTVGDLRLDRQVNSSTSAFLNLNREITDQTSGFDLAFGDFSFDVQETNTVEVTALEAGARTGFSDGGTLGLTVGGSRSDYIGSATQEESGYGVLRYTRPITPLLTLSTEGRYRVIRYAINETEDQVANAEAGLVWHVTRALRVSSYVGRERRFSDVRSREYTENWASVSLNYQFQ